MESTDVPQLSLDQFVAERQIQRVDLIKIDTDGHELEVIRGARRCLATHSPKVIFELCLYLLEERGVSFSDYARVFSELNYRMICLPGGELITESNCSKLVPSRGGIDVLATNIPAAPGT